VRVDARAPAHAPPTGYPIATSFDDEGARAGWALSGAWGFGSPDGERVGAGGAFLDNNPEQIDQYDLGNQVALLDVPLVIPADGSPVVSFAYNASFLHPSDKVDLQLEDPASGTWSTVFTFKAPHARAGLTHRTVPLTDYRGKTTRLRLRQAHGKATGARRFVLDDLYVGPLALPTLPWPLEAGFETELERSRWNLEGAWQLEHDDTFEGETALSVNPDDRDLSGFGPGQVAELTGFLPVPADGHPVVGFWYRTDLAAKEDHVDVDVQVEGDPQWHDLVRFTPRRDHTTWTYREASLSGYAGQRVRVRLALSSQEAAAAPRRFIIDGVRFGELAGPDLPYPFACDFGAACAGSWATGGMLEAAEIDGDPRIQASPAMLDESGDGHDLGTLGFVTLPATGDSVLRFRAQLGFVHDDDKLKVDVQDRSSGQWQTLRTYTREHARDWTTYEVPLGAYAGRALRVRFRASYGKGEGARAVAIDDVRIGAQPATRFAYPHAPTLESAAGWITTGAWQATPEGLDANPAGIDDGGFADGHDLVMDGFVTLPASGRPTLLLALDIGLVDPDDRVHLELQVAGQGAWTKLRTYTSIHNRDAIGWDEHALDAWRGQAVRVRARFDFAPTEGARRFVIAGVRFEELAPQALDAPWQSGFDSEDELAGWTLWGAWSGSPSRAERTSSGGAGFLDGNPMAVAQRKWETLQTATTDYAIRVPAQGPTWLGFEHHVGAVHKDDRLRLQVQPQGTSGWTSLATLTREHAPAGWSALELPLDDYRGQAIRVRFELTFGASDVVHDVGVDRLWIGKRALPVIAGRYDHSFAAPVTDTFVGPTSDADWSLHGTWGFGDAALHANPTLVANAGYKTFQTATLDRVIDLAGVTAPTLTLTYTLALADAGDRVFVEVATPGTTTAWATVATLKLGDNAASPTTRSWSLAGYAGQQMRARLRTSMSAAQGVRDFAAQRIVIGAP